MSRNKATSLRECLGRLGLEKLPFTDKIPPEECWFGVDDYLGTIQWYIENIDDLKKANLLLLGDYGTGKTFTLQTLRYEIAEETPDLIPIYLKMEEPERGFRSVYEFFMMGIGKDRLISILDEAKVALNSKKEFLDYLNSFLVTRDVCTALATIAFDDRRKELALSWISGTGGYWEARKLGLDIYASHYKHALSMMTDIIRFISHHRRGVVVLMDEMENLVGRARRVREVREGLRDFYDEIVYSDVGSVVIITACTGETYAELSEHLGEAFRDRIDEEVIIPPLTDEMAESYLNALFAWAKGIPPSENTSPEPFENEAALKTFLEMASSYRDPIRPARGLTRRKIIKTGLVVLRATCQRNLNSISNDVLEEVLAKRIAGFSS